MIFGPVVQEEITFKKRLRTTDGRRTKTDHNSSGEIKRGLQYLNDLPYSTEVQWDISDLPFNIYQVI